MLDEGFPALAISTDGGSSPGPATEGVVLCDHSCEWMHCTRLRGRRRLAQLELCRARDTTRLSDRCQPLFSFRFLWFLIARWRWISGPVAVELDSDLASF